MRFTFRRGVHPAANKEIAKDVPLSVATIDMDWHYSDFVDEEKGITVSGRNDKQFGGNNGWTGFSWNKNLFPDYKAFLQEIKKRKARKFSFPCVKK